MAWVVSDDTILYTEQNGHHRPIFTGHCKFCWNLINVSFSNERTAIQAIDIAFSYISQINFNSSNTFMISHWSFQFIVFMLSNGTSLWTAAILLILHFIRHFWILIVSHKSLKAFDSEIHFWLARHSVFVMTDINLKHEYSRSYEHVTSVRSSLKSVTQLRNAMEKWPFPLT